MKLEFCVACGSKDDLQQHHLLMKVKGGSDAEHNRITLCTSCHDKLHQGERNGARNHSQRIKTGLAARRARGASIGRPKKLMPRSAQGGIAAAGGWRARADVARSYGLSKATISRMVRSARLSGGSRHGLAMQ